MGPRKCSKYQIPCIGHPLVYLHSGKMLISFPDLHDMGEIKSAVHSMAHHIHRHGDDIHVAGALPVAEQSALHTICTS